MSDGKRRRYRKIKDTGHEKLRPIILAKRPDDERVTSSSGNVHKFVDLEMQPKILLKTKTDKEIKEAKEEGQATSTKEIAQQMPIKTIIITRSEATQSPALSATTSPNITKESTLATANSDQSQTSATVPQLVEPVPNMMRPATVISSTGFINASARKLLLKANTDFLVVGIIGTQGVGKSTIMNLLANEDPNYDYQRKVFVEEDSYFPTKLKPHKCSARSRTESTHMFITPDRMILLDSPPVLCNSYKKDMTTNELDDLRNIISFLSVCHLLIVVQDDYFNMNFMRLLQFAELMKPSQDNKPFASDYLPNVLFVKNRAKRQDFIPGQKERMDRMLRAFFKDSQLRIFLGQTAAEQQRQRKPRVPDAERVVNSFLLPEVKDSAATSFHKALPDIVNELRTLVFMTPRNDMYTGPAELTEATWFELLTKVSQDMQHFFFNTYEEIQRKHFDVGVASSLINSKDTHDTWKD